MQKTKAILIAGLGFGDEGKGTTTDFLTRTQNVHTIVCYNGRAQAAHHVVLPDGRVHCFAQFGSGTFVPHVETYLSQYALMEPARLLSEAEALGRRGAGDALERMIIHREALVITPYHKLASQMREIARGVSKHGSCGIGIGETMRDSLGVADVLRVKDIARISEARRKLKVLRGRKIGILNMVHEKNVRESLEVLQNRMQSPVLLENILDVYADFVRSSIRIDDGSYFQKLMNRPGTVLFEGAQGVLLDPVYGFDPYTTSTRCTFMNADSLLSEVGYTGQVVKLGVMRAYATRHGVGPFPTEDERLHSAFPEIHNATNEWQDGFRVGWFDGVLARYAISCLGNIDGVALTHMDRFEQCSRPMWSNAYELATDPRDIIDDPSCFRGISLKQRTNMMFSVRPRLQEIQNSSSEGYVHFFEDVVKTRVVISSHGPTHEAKTIRALL